MSCDQGHLCFFSHYTQWVWTTTHICLHFFFVIIFFLQPSVWQHNHKRQEKIQQLLSSCKIWILCLLVLAHDRFLCKACSLHKLKQISVFCPSHFFQGWWIDILPKAFQHKRSIAEQKKDLKFTTIVLDFLFPVAPSNMSVRAEIEAGRHSFSLHSSAIERDRRLTYHFTCCWCCGGRSSGSRVELSAVEHDLTALTARNQSGEVLVCCNYFKTQLIFWNQYCFVCYYWVILGLFCVLPTLDCVSRSLLVTWQTTLVSSNVFKSFLSL